MDIKKKKRWRIYNMDIEKALETITGFLDMLSSELSEEELDLIGEAEEVIYQFVKEHQ